MLCCEPQITQNVKPHGQASGNFLSLDILYQLLHAGSNVKSISLIATQLGIGNACSRLLAEARETIWHAKRAEFAKRPDYSSSYVTACRLPP